MPACHIRNSLVVAALAATTLPGIVHGQTPALQRGSVLLSGQASFDVADRSSSDEKETTFLLLPSIQYFAGRGLALGGELSLTHASAGDFSSSSYGIGPAISYYFVKESDLHPFVRGSFRIAQTSSEISGTERDATVFGVRATGGVLFLLSESVGLDIGLYYDRYQLRGDAEVDVSTLGLAVGISAFAF
jgi:outer membrane protein